MEDLSLFGELKVRRENGEVIMTFCEKKNLGITFLPHSQALRDHMLSTSYDNRMQNLRDAMLLDPINQFSIYNTQIYSEAWVRGAQAQTDTATKLQMFDEAMSMHQSAIDAATLQVVSTNIPTAQPLTSANAYSAPSTVYGAEPAGSIYFAWPGAFWLFSVEWASNVFIVGDIIWRDPDTTQVQKDLAQQHMFWARRNVFERHQTTSNFSHNQINNQVERMVSRNVPDFPLDDKVMLAAICSAYIHYWWGVWGITLPVAHTQLFSNDTPQFRLRQDYIGHTRDILGVTFGDTGFTYGEVKDKGISIDPGGGHLVFEPDSGVNNIYDVFHANRVVRLILSMKHLDVGAGDAQLDQRLDDLTVALDANFDLFMTQLVNGCIVTSTNIDGTPDAGGFITQGNPIAAWGALIVGDPAKTEKWRAFIEQIDEGPSGACWTPAHANAADEVNYANVCAWLALSDKIASEGGTKAEQRAKVWLGFA